MSRRAVFTWLLVLWVLAASSPPCAAGDVCVDGDGDGFHAAAGCGTVVDCNDADPATHPGNPESCDAFDRDCSGLVDDQPECATACPTPNEGVDRRLTDAAGTPGTPSMAWTGDGYAVAWHEVLPGGERIVFARLDASGHPVGPEVELEAAGQARGASVAWTGSEFGVAWWSNATGAREIAFARLDAVGQPLGGVTRVTTDPGAARWPSLVWTGAEYGIAWFDDRTGTSEVFFTRLDRDGVEVGDDLQITAGGGAFPILIWNGVGYGLAWTREAGGPLAQFAPLDADGIVQGPVVTVTQGRPAALEWNGVEYGLLWRDPQSPARIRFSRVDAQGSPAGLDKLVIDDQVAGTTPALAWIGAEYGLVWIAAPATAPAVQFGRMPSTGGAPTAVVRVTDIVPAVSATLAWTGRQFASVWVGQGGDGAELYFSQVYCECDDQDGDGFTNCEECDDTDGTVHPLATEVGCDQKDNDCDPATPDIVDADGDGYPCSVDCVDVNPHIFPGNVCDILADDCTPLAGIDDCDLDGIPDECATFVAFETAWQAGIVSPSMIRAADLDGDGGNELILGTVGGGIYVYPNDGSGIFGTRRYLSTDDSSSVWPVDLDGDGDLDLVADSGLNIIWFENPDGSGDFGTPRLIATVPGSVVRVYPADLDGDGDLDVAFSAGGQSRFGWYENLGAAASFGPERPIGNASASDLLAADLDGDGDNDLLGTSPPQWYENLDGRGTFGPARLITGVSAPTSYSVDASDFDDDGDLDVVALFFSPGSARLFRNLDGRGNFDSGEQLAVVNGAATVQAADLDGDGDEDVLTTSLYDGQVAWQENLGTASGRFAEPREIFNSQFGETAVAAADLDNDGDLDVISNNQVDWDVHWFRNIGNDCNGNKVPDACEPDCNANGIADACDVRSGAGFDCDTNGVLDECEIACMGACSADGDACADELDCDAEDPGVWSAPGPARRLLLHRELASTRLTWRPPSFPEPPRCATTSWSPRRRWIWPWRTAWNRTGRPPRQSTPACRHRAKSPST